MARKAAPKASKTSKKAKGRASSRTRGQASKAAPKPKKPSKKASTKTSAAKAKKAKKATTRAATKPKSEPSKTRAKTARGPAVGRQGGKVSGSGKPGSGKPASGTRAKPLRPPVAGARPAASGAARRNERPLSPQDVEQFRRMLMEKRTEILGDVSTLHNEALNKDRRDALGDLSSMPIHMADLGTDNYELEFTLGLIEGERAILQEIDEALERIRQGTYGLCLATGKPIGKARLKAKPWAKYCYEYTLAQEQSQGRGL